MLCEIIVRQGCAHGGSNQPKNVLSCFVPNLKH